MSQRSSESCVLYETVVFDEDLLEILCIRLFLGSSPHCGPFYPGQYFAEYDHLRLQKRVGGDKGASQSY